MVRKTYTARLTSKGQITVPQEIRRRLGLRTGDRVEFVARKRDTIVRRPKAKDNSFEKYAGIFKDTFPGGIKDVNAWIRDLRGPL